MCEYRERRKPGLRAGYGRDLERRLDRLEEMVTTHDRLFEEYLRPSPNVQEANAASSVDANLHSLAPIGHISNSSPSQTMEARPSLVTRTSHLSAGQQIAHPQLQAERQSVQGPTGHHDTAQPISALTGSLYPERPNKDQPWYYAKPRSIATNVAQAQLPPHELLYSLVNLYFEHINTWFPILHRQTTFEILFGSTSLSEADCMMLHAIVATTLRFCNDPGLTRDEQDQYHDSSKQRVLLYALENSSVRSLQAMVILALDLTGTVNGPPAWNLLALITRNIIHLGLATESTSSMSTPTRPSIYTLRAAVLSEPETWIEDEERRRLFWGAYILDRYATISTAFDFGLNEKEIVRRLPCDNTLFVANIPAETSWFSPLGRLSYAEYHTENLGSFAFYCELLGIISRIHQFLKRPVLVSELSRIHE
jgi:Fungal specific transcription factor domain